MEYSIIKLSLGGIGMKNNEENLFEVLANIETIQKLIKNKEEKNGEN